MSQWSTPSKPGKPSTASRPRTSHRSLCTIAAVGLIALGALAASAFTMVADRDHPWQPSNGMYSFRQLAYRVPGPEPQYLRSDCFVSVEPIQQRIVWDTGTVRVYTGATMSCNPSDLAFTQRDWSMKVTAQGVGVVREDSGHESFDPAWKPLGGVVQLSSYSFPCWSVNPGQAGSLGWVKAELTVTMVDTDGREWTTTATDYDGIICRPHRK